MEVHLSTRYRRLSGAAGVMVAVQSEAQEDDVAVVGWRLLCPPGALDCRLSVVGASRSTVQEDYVEGLVGCPLLQLLWWLLGATHRRRPWKWFGGGAFVHLVLLTEGCLSWWLLRAQCRWVMWEAWWRRTFCVLHA